MKCYECGSDKFQLSEGYVYCTQCGVVKEEAIFTGIM